jgi:deoxyadenosine/deoxycytidine kinase
MQLSLPRYIAVEGPIGVGKTSLAKRLAGELNAELLLECPEENPFLARFYESPRQSALPTQLCFLMQRAQQMEDLLQGDILNPVRVADFMMEKDCLFARLTLDHSELELYERIYEHVSVIAPTPDLVVYLQAPVSKLLERIRKRGRSYEDHIQPEYLERINQSYADFFRSYVDAPLLVIDAAEVDLIGNDSEFEAVLEQVCNLRPAARRFFNTSLLAS